MGSPAKIRETGLHRAYFSSVRRARVFRSLAEEMAANAARNVLYRAVQSGTSSIWEATAAQCKRKPLMELLVGLKDHGVGQRVVQTHYLDQGKVRRKFEITKVTTTGPLKGKVFGIQDKCYLEPSPSRLSSTKKHVWLLAPNNNT